jgi:hypothetical protein
MRTLTALLASFVMLSGTLTAEASETLPSPRASPTAQPREQLSQAWWTGPLLAAGAATLPRGHMFMEAYLFDVIGYAAYNPSGAIVPATHANSYGSLTYLVYGLANRFSVGAIPTFGYAESSGGPNSNGLRLGDISVFGQYELTSYKIGHWTPTMSVNLQETLPSGQYDRLNGNTNNGLGAGAYSTKISLYTQDYAWLGNGRIIRIRLNLSGSSSSGASLRGESVYGSDIEFDGSIHPGNGGSVDGAAEYSITQHWVAASDVLYSCNADTRLIGTDGITNLGPSHSLALAPAIEYNWTSNDGIIIGLRYLPSGANTRASITPIFALNMVR